MTEYGKPTMSEGFSPPERPVSRLERYALKRFHPRALFIDAVGITWFVYFLWNQNWLLALGTAIAGRIAALAAVSHAVPEQIAETPLGRLALLHLNPINMAIQGIGAVVACVGIWSHSMPSILIGLSVVLLGHLRGWRRFDPRFAA
jgi:hypothetical protein